MGFYFRKSVSVGPLRFNFSKSGIGVSTGIPGFRVGTGPRGNYVHVGRGGFYYRKTFSSTSSKAARPSLSSLNQQNPDLNGTVGFMHSVSSSDVAELVDSSSHALLSELNEKRNRLLLWPLWGVFSLVFVGVLLWNSAPAALTLSLGIVLAISTMALIQYDALKKSVVIMFDLEEESSIAFRKLFTTIERIGQSHRIWHVHHRADVFDPKYHAGAGAVQTRSSASILIGDPPYVKTNLSIPALRLQNCSLYFFPDQMLFFTAKGVGAVPYQDFQVEDSAIRFIESGGVPHDATVVGQTWQYVNKDGGPDRRFKLNSQLPICLYEELQFKASKGLQETIQLSQKGHGAELRSAIGTMAAVIEAAKEAERDRMARELKEIEESRERLETKKVEKPIEPPVIRSSHFESPELLCDFLCCLVASDGKISPQERRLVNEFMSRRIPGWNKSQTDDRIVYFAERVRKRGFKLFVSDTLNRVRQLPADHAMKTFLTAVNSFQENSPNLDARTGAILQQLSEISKC